MTAQTRARRELANLLAGVVERERRDVRRQEGRVPRTSFRRLKEIERALLRAKRSRSAR